MSLYVWQVFQDDGTRYRKLRRRWQHCDRCGRISHHPPVVGALTCPACGHRETEGLRHPVPAFVWNLKEGAWRRGTGATPAAVSARIFACPAFIDLAGSSSWGRP
jgi:ribosomal protein L37E